MLFRSFSDDGVIYKEEYTDSDRFSYISKTDIEGVIYNTVYDIIKKVELRNFYYSHYVSYISASLNIEWKSMTSDSNSCTGYIGNILDGQIYPVGQYTTTELKYFNSFTVS